MWSASLGYMQIIYMWTTPLRNISFLNSSLLYCLIYFLLLSLRYCCNTLSAQSLPSLPPDILNLFLLFIVSLSLLLLDHGSVYLESSARQNGASTLATAPLWSLGEQRKQLLEMEHRRQNASSSWRPGGRFSFPNTGACIDRGNGLGGSTSS